MDFSKLWEIRSSLGYSLRALEKATGISKTEINNIENNRANPTIETLERLAKGLNLELIELLQLYL